LKSSTKKQVNQLLIWHINLVYQIGLPNILKKTNPTKWIQKN